MNGKINYKVIINVNDVHRVIDLQSKIWTIDVITPLPQLIAAVHNGGVIIGAYDKEEIIGFCYGFPCFKDGQTYLCSHMAGIDPNYRNLGIGNQLKNKQRDWALKYGYKKIVWTFDPLETRNAYLNLNKLGGYVRTYIEDYYGSMSDPLNKNLPSDRFLLEWNLDSVKTVKNIQEESQKSEYWKTFKSIIQCEAENKLSIPVKSFDIENDNGYLIPVPTEIHIIKQNNIEVAKKWRLELRKIFKEAFSKEYIVVSLIRGSDSVHYYVLEKNRRRKNVNSN